MQKAAQGSRRRENAREALISTPLLPLSRRPIAALMKLAIRVYPRSKTVDEAFQRVLMENVLPLA